MASKKQYLDYTPWWVNQLSSITDFPDYDCETYFYNKGYQWKDYDEKAKGVFQIPQGQWDTASLTTTDENYPKFVKFTPDVNKPENVIYYFCVGMTPVNVRGNATKFRYSYRMEPWSTFGYEFHKLFKDANIYCRFIKKHCDRMLYYWENGVVSDDLTKLHINIDFWRTLPFSKTIPHNYTMKKKFLWSTSPTELEILNDVPQDSSNPFQYTNYLQSNNRFKYIVCNTTALKYFTKDANDQITAQSHATQNIYIIPCPNDGSVETAAQSVNILHVDSENFVPLAEGEMICSFFSDVPPSIYWKALSNVSTKDVIEKNTIYWMDSSNAEHPLEVQCLVAGVNQAVRFKLRKYNPQTNDIMGRMVKIINNARTQANYQTETALLHPNFYYEAVHYEDNAFIKTDVSQINFKFGFKQNDDGSYSLNTDDLYLYANCCWTTGETMWYDWGENQNDSNPTQNNNNTSNRMVNPYSAANLGSAASNMYDQGPLQMYTAIKNNEATNKLNFQTAAMEETRQDANLAFNISKNEVSSQEGGIIGFFNGTNEVKAAQAGIQDAQDVMNAGFDSAERWMDLNKQTKQNNRNLANQMSNTMGSSGGQVSAPFIGSFTKNIDAGNNRFLFRTYSYELNEWDLEDLYITDYINGYNFDSFKEEKWIEEEEEPVWIYGYNMYDNRRVWNILNLDIEYNMLAFLDLINNQSIKSNWMFWKKEYLKRSLSLLGSQLRLWKIDAPSIDISKVDNIENSLPPIPTSKINIADLIVNTQLELVGWMDEDIEHILDELYRVNPSLPLDLREYLILTLHSNTVRTIDVNVISNDTYFGNTDIYYTKVKFNDLLTFVPNDEHSVATITDFDDYLNIILNFMTVGAIIIDKYKQYNLYINDYTALIQKYSNISVNKPDDYTSDIIIKENNSDLFYSDQITISGSDFCFIFKDKIDNLIKNLNINLFSGSYTGEIYPDHSMDIKCDGKNVNMTFNNGPHTDNETFDNSPNAIGKFMNFPIISFKLLKLCKFDTQDETNTFWFKISDGKSVFIGNTLAIYPITDKFGFSWYDNWNDGDACNLIIDFIIPAPIGGGYTHNEICINNMTVKKIIN